MMEVSIILNSIVFDGSPDVPEERTAVVAFEIRSGVVGAIELSINVVPEADDPHGVDGAVMIAARTLVEFGKTLAAVAESYKPPRIYSPKGE